jgi:serine/threonine protein kinase
MHAGRFAELSLAQPADAQGSPRWDYVIKRAIDVHANPESFRQIAHFTNAAASISHPNLIPVLDASASGASPYVVMPRIEGATMQAHLEMAQTKPLPVALWLVRQMAQALAAIHAAGWIHGDVKPDNVIVGPGGHVTMIDLGFATQIHTANESQFRGTPDYAAPEALHGNMAALPAADMFALGRVLWRWLTHVDTAYDAALGPVAELIEHLVAEDPQQRPDAQAVTRQLLRLEIDTLGRHLDPAIPRRMAA